jgi:uncharacterized protein (DUF1778 family)
VKNLYRNYLGTEFVRTFALKNYETNIMSATAKLTGKTRFDARLSVQEKELFERAADLGGFRSLTDFIIKAAKKRAEEIIQETEQVLASKRDSEIFFNALLKPEPPNKALRDAAKRYK